MRFQLILLPWIFKLFFISFLLHISLALQTSQGVLRQKWCSGLWLYPPHSSFLLSAGVETGPNGLPYSERSYEGISAGTEATPACPTLSELQRRLQKVSVPASFLGSSVKATSKDLVKVTCTNAQMKLVKCVICPHSFALLAPLQKESRWRHVKRV